MVRRLQARRKKKISGGNMKLRATLALMLLGANAYQARSQQAYSEYQAAQAYLDRKGEVYFSFDLVPEARIHDITNSLSIDEIEGRKVYAYANRGEFEAFADRGLVYQVETHPGDMLANPSMAATPDEVRAEWDKYPTYEAYVAMMKEFPTRYPKLCKLVPIGKSIQGRELLYIKISDNIDSTEMEPRHMFTSAMHGDETACYVNFLRLIDHLLSQYNTDPYIKKLVDNIEIWICPLENPDATYLGGNSTVSGARRFNMNNTDLNRHYPLAGEALPANYRSKDPEAAAVIKLTDSLEFVLSANTHGGAELLNYPWDYANIIHVDEKWMVQVYRQFADEVHKVAPNVLTDQSNGITRGYVWYQILGSRMDYLTYHRGMREVTLEASRTKLLPESQYPSLWSYYQKPLLKLIEQNLFGINGSVTSATTGAAIRAKVRIVGHDDANSVMYSKLPHGGFWRPIAAGTYNVEFSAAGYQTYVANGVQVQADMGTPLHVKLTPIGTPSLRPEQMFEKAGLKVFTVAGALQVTFTGSAGEYHGAVCDFRGKVVKAFRQKKTRGAATWTWNGLDEAGRRVPEGFYLVRLESGPVKLGSAFVLAR